MLNLLNLLGLTTAKNAIVELRGLALLYLIYRTISNPGLSLWPKPELLVSIIPIADDPSSVEHGPPRCSYKSLLLFVVVQSTPIVGWTAMF